MKQVASAIALRAIAGAISVAGLLPAAPGNAADLIVNIDQASVHRLVREAATIVVGNPSIADVSVQGGRMLLVMGKNPGHTNIIALDRTGAEIEDVDVHVRNAGSRQLTLHLGSSRLSYNCAPKCDRTLTVSDAEQPFTTHQTQVQGKMSVSQGIADQAGAGGQ